MEIDYYEPKYLMLQALKANFNDESLIAAEKEFAAYLQTHQMNRDNVCVVLRLLLSIEDLSTMKIFALLMETDLIVQEMPKDNKKEILYQIKLNQTKVNPEDVLTVDIDELVLVPKASVLASPRKKHIILEQLPHKDEVLWKEHRKFRHVCQITNIERKNITFSCNTLKELMNYYNTINKLMKFNVIFRSSRIPTRLMYEAIGYLQASSTLRSYLFPLHNKQSTDPQTSESDLSTPFTLINASIATNVDQLQAVKQIVAGPSPLAPYIVFGPPGTGKTTTLVEAILQLYLQSSLNRIIVTAGSNSACDTIALRICECIEQDARFDYKPKLTNGIIMRVYSDKRSKKDLKLVHPLVLRNSNYRHLTMTREERESQNPIDLWDYPIIVATLCKVACLARKKWDEEGNPKQNVLWEGLVTHVFIDEAAASSEPESLLGIVHLKTIRCHVILSGDHKQLGPVIMSKRASSLGLGQSLMGRLMDSELYQVDESGNYDCTLQTRLRRNYRSHPEIVGLFNKLYYNNELIPLAPLERINQAAHWDMLPNGQFPILFQATFGKTQRPPLSHSSYNELEAEVVCWFVWILLKQGLGNGSKVKQEDIGVITPYLAQCALLTKYLRQRGKFHVKVGSVESFQGREKPIIIASLVCSFTSAAFLSDPRRLNVLLSRPMSLLILIGNPISLSQTADLKFIIDQCKLHGHLLTKKKDKNNKKKERTTKEETDTLSTDMSKKDKKNKNNKKKLHNKEQTETPSTETPKKNKKYKNNKKKLQNKENTKTLSSEMSNLALVSSTAPEQSKEISI